MTINLKAIVQVVRLRWLEGYEPGPLFVLADSSDSHCGRVFNILEGEEEAQDIRDTLEASGEEVVLLKFEVIPRRTQA